MASKHCWVSITMLFQIAGSLKFLKWSIFSQQTKLLAVEDQVHWDTSCICRIQITQLVYHSRWNFYLMLLAIFPWWAGEHEALLSSLQSISNRSSLLPAPNWFLNVIWIMWLQRSRNPEHVPAHGFIICPLAPHHDTGAHVSGLSHVEFANEWKGFAEWCWITS